MKVQSGHKSERILQEYINESAPMKTKISDAVALLPSKRANDDIENTDETVEEESIQPLYKRIKITANSCPNPVPFNQFSNCEKITINNYYK